jgi:hypothetical protein
VVKILANNSTNPELLASAAATITRALQHHTFDAPPTALLKAGLLPALVGAIHSLKSEHCGAFTTTTLPGVDSIAAAFNALLAPCAQRYLQDHFTDATLEAEPPSWDRSSYAPWRPAFECLLEATLAGDLIAVAFHNWQPLQPGAPLPGSQVMKLVGMHRHLTMVYQATGDHYAAYVDEGSVRRLLAVYERELHTGSTLLKCAALARPSPRCTRAQCVQP